MKTVTAAVLLAALAGPPAFAQGYAPDNAVDARVRASAEAAESYQGPLDGGWTLVDAAGHPIYAFQLVDKVGGQGALEGVFRDLRHPALPGDIGFIEALDRAPDALTVTLRPKPGDPLVVISLKSGPDGWAGDLRQGTTDTPVRMRRE